jgi:hypothetical protein
VFAAGVRVLDGSTLEPDDGARAAGPAWKDAGDPVIEQHIPDELPDDRSDTRPDARVDDRTAPRPPYRMVRYVFDPVQPEEYEPYLKGRPLRIGDTEQLTCG